MNAAILSQVFTDTANSPSSSAASFASLLAGLTSPKVAAEPAKPTDRWSDDLLAEDVATISYERALQARARYLSSDGLSDDARPIEMREEPQEETAVPPRKPPASVRITEWSPLATLAANRKSASITIRMNEAECRQLRERAAAAGLTISAYLRSCIFEAEELRAQVKQTLSQLRSDPAEFAEERKPKAVETGYKPGRAAPPGLRSRLFGRWRQDARVASA